MANDHYETLQVHPRADQGAIQAAYQRLRELYDPARLEGAAEEFIELARQKRDTIERAYAVLSDPVRRQQYDAELAATRSAPTPAEESDAEPDELLDYRPLPPAGNTERERHFDTQPVAGRGRVAPPRRVPSWAVPVAFVVLAALVTAAVVLLSDNNATLAVSLGPPPAVATPSPLDQLDEDIRLAQTVAQQNPDNPRALIDYANLLYDSAEIVRENAPNSVLYQERLPRWLQATEAYSQALALEPDNHVVRATMGESQCFYGAGTGDQDFVRRGLEDARRAAENAPQSVRVLWSLSQCLFSSQPPQTDEAVAVLQRIIELDPETPFAVQARQLILRYEN